MPSPSPPGLGIEMWGSLRLYLVTFSSVYLGDECHRPGRVTGLPGACQTAAMWWITHKHTITHSWATGRQCGEGGTGERRGVASVEDCSVIHLQLIRIRRTAWTRHDSALRNVFSHFFVGFGSSSSFMRGFLTAHLLSPLLSLSWTNLAGWNHTRSAQWNYTGMMKESNKLLQNIELHSIQKNAVVSYCKIFLMVC